jgi:hypothetical protein
MTEEQAKQTANLIFKDVFGRESPYSLPEVRQKLGFDLHLPIEMPCAKSGKEVSIYRSREDDRVVSQEAFMAQTKIDDWMQPATPISNMTDLLAAWEKVHFMTGDKSVNSQQMTKSDSILNSSNVYGSALVGGSKNMLFCENDFFSNYLIASAGNNSCNFCIRAFDSEFCASSFEVRFCNKVAKSLFINDAGDLYECMFCYGIRSKKYCIANMQFSQEEYMKIKPMVIEWIFKEYLNRH